MYTVFINVIHLLLIYIIYIKYNSFTYCTVSFYYICTITFQIYIFLALPVWKFFDNRCVFSLITKEAGDFEDVKTKNPFYRKIFKMAL